MQKLLLSLALLLGFSIPAFSQTAATAGAASQAGSISGSLSAAGITTSGASATQGVGNKQEININSNIPGYQQLDHTGTSTVRMAPQVYAPSMGVTAPCRIALSAGVSVVAVGVVAGGSVEDLKCNWRENDRHCISAGDKACSAKWQRAIAKLECLQARGDERKALSDICDEVGIPDPDRPNVTRPAVPQPLPVSSSSTKPCISELRDGIMTKTCPL